MIFDSKKILDKYLGIPYLHMGRTLEGLDCWGLIVLIYKDEGIELFDLNNYSAEWARRKEDLIIKNYYEKWEKLIHLSFKTGDVILFKMANGLVNHAGIYLGGGRFLQASKQGVIVSRTFDWQSKIYGYYRYKDKT